MVVGSNALPSSSPSLIWLQLGFGLARAVTICSLEDERTFLKARASLVVRIPVRLSVTLDFLVLLCVDCTYVCIGIETGIG